MVGVTFVSFVSDDNQLMSPQLPIAAFRVSEPVMELTVDTRLSRASTSPESFRMSESFKICQIDAGAKLSFTAAQKSHYLSLVEVQINVVVSLSVFKIHPPGTSEISV